MDEDGDRHREADLVAFCKKAWNTTPLVNILRAFEMRRDVAKELGYIHGHSPQIRELTRRTWVYTTTRTQIRYLTMHIWVYIQKFFPKARVD
jgi:hypothetical protein